MNCLFFKTYFAFSKDLNKKNSNSPQSLAKVFANGLKNVDTSKSVFQQLADRIKSKIKVEPIVEPDAKKEKPNENSADCEKSYKKAITDYPTDEKDQEFIKIVAEFVAKHGRKLQKVLIHEHPDSYQFLNEKGDYNKFYCEALDLLERVAKKQENSKIKIKIRSKFD